MTAPADIRFTRNYERLVDRTYPLLSSENPYCLTWDKPLSDCLSDLLTPFSQNLYDYIEAFSPNPIPNTRPHIGHQVNALLGVVYSNLCGIPFTCYINDLGLNFCRGYYGYRKGVPYHEVDMDDVTVGTTVKGYRKLFFEQGLPSDAIVARDTAINSFIQHIARIFKISRPPLMYHQSSLSQNLKTLFSTSKKDGLGRPLYGDLPIGTSDLLPLYAGTDVCYRRMLLKTYKSPLLIIGCDQKDYHDRLSRLGLSVTLLTNPCIKSDSQKISKRSGDDLSFSRLLETFKSRYPCVTLLALKRILALDLLMHSKRSKIDIGGLMTRATVKYWLAHTEFRGHLLLPEQLLKYPLYIRHWSYLNDVKTLVLRDLDIGIILKYFEVALQKARSYNSRALLLDCTSRINLVLDELGLP